MYCRPLLFSAYQRSRCRQCRSGESLLERVRFGLQEVFVRLACRPAGFYAQFSFQHMSAGMVDTQRGCPVSIGSMETHQAAIDFFMQRISMNPSLRAFDSGIIVSLLFM